MLPLDLLTGIAVATLSGGVDAVQILPVPTAGRYRLWAVSLGFRDSTPARNPLTCIVVDHTNTTFTSQWQAIMGLSGTQTSDWCWLPGGRTLRSDQPLYARLRGTANDQVVILVYYNVEQA